MNKRLSRFAVGVVSGAIVLSACSNSAGEATTTTTSAATTTPATPPQATTTTTTATVGGSEVSIENFVFGPSDLAVSVGDTIVWTNDETAVGHTATSDDGLWDSKVLSPGETFEFTFTEAGTFTYFCTIHPSMQASVTVTG